MEKQKTLLFYQKRSNQLDTVEAIMSKMTLHGINQRSDYLDTQLEELDEFDVHLNVALYLPDDAELNMGLITYVERIKVLERKSTEAQRQDCYMDGQEQTNIESEIDDEKSDEQSQKLSNLFRIVSTRPVPRRA